MSTAPPPRISGAGSTCTHLRNRLKTSQHGAKLERKRAIFLRDAFWVQLKSYGAVGPKAMAVIDTVLSSQGDSKNPSIRKASPSRSSSDRDSELLEKGKERQGRARFSAGSDVTCGEEIASSPEPSTSGVFTACGRRLR